MSLQYLSRILLICVSFINLQCTSNPLFDDPKNTYDRHTISGTVSLQNGKSPDNIYVWFEDIHLHTSTGVNGNFSINLPNTPQYQGLNGAYRLFFYLGNYKYSTASVIIREGLFEYGERDVTGDGKVSGISPLSELISISTNVITEGLTLNQPDTLWFDIILEKKTTSPVSVIFYRDNRNFMTGFFVRKSTDARSQSAILRMESYRPVTESIQNTLTLRSYLFWSGTRLDPGFYPLTPGEYEIFPYIFIEQEGLPDSLIKSFGSDARLLAPDYLNIPFKQTTDFFRILAD